MGAHQSRTAGGSVGDGPAPDGRALRIAVAAACRHEEMADALLAEALQGLADCRVEEPTVVRVATPAQLPVVTKTLAGVGYHGVVCLGVGDDADVPGPAEVWQAVTAVAVAQGVAVGFAVLPESRLAGGAATPADGLGRRAARSAVETALLLRRLRHGELPGHRGPG